MTESEGLVHFASGTHFESNKFYFIYTEKKERTVFRQHTIFKTLADY